MESEQAGLGAAACAGALCGAGLNGACTLSSMCARVVSPAMRAHTRVDSGAEWSLCRGGHEVREGGKGR